MKVLLVSNSVSGGAGKACLRLYEALKGAGHEAKILQLEGKKSADPDVVSYYPDVRSLFLRQLTGFPVTVLKHFLIGDRGRRYRLPSAIHRMERHPLVDWADLINLHWVPDFVDYKRFFGRIGRKPVVWTMHDMLPFASGYHYEAERPTPSIAVERRIGRSKRAAIAAANLAIVAPSSWLLGVSQDNGTFAGLRHRHIFNGLPLDVYQPIEKKTARRMLGLPEDKKIVLFTADRVESLRKGGQHLVDGLGQLRNQDVMLVSVGRGRMEMNIGLDYRHLGSFADEVSMVICYSAADVVVLPSIEDNSPNIIIESFACGRPVVGFRVGGIPELVCEDGLGVVVEFIDGRSLASGITGALAAGFSENHIRRDAELRFSYAALSGNYVRLFEEMLQE